MTEDRADKDKLLELIRLASAESDNADRPSDEALVAFLQGTANDAEKVEVREAVAGSSTFRKEFRSILRDMEAIEAGRSVVDLQLPDQVPSNIQQDVLSFYEPDGRWSWFKESPIIRLYAPVAVAASILFFAITSLIPPSMPEWQLVRSEIEKAELISVQTRSLHDLEFATAEQAALEGFRQMLEFTDGEFKIDTSRSVTASSAPTKQITMALTDSAGTTVVQYTCDVPRSVEPENHELTSWLLTMPERTMYMVAVTSDTVIIRAPLLGIDNLSVFTYRSPAGYRVTRGLKLK